MVSRMDAIVQSMFRDIYWVWHGGSISEAAVGDWRVPILWVCRECLDGGGCDYAGFRNASDMAFVADIDGGGMGAYLRIGDIGGGEVGRETRRLRWKWTRLFPSARIENVWSLLSISARRYACGPKKKLPWI